MVEPLFKKSFNADPTIGQVITLDGEEGKHAASVRRMRVGEAVVLADGLGLKVRGVVAEVSNRSIGVEVEAVEKLAEPALKLRLIQALAKGDRDELAIQAATELGVTAVTPWQSDRSVSRWDSAKAAKGQERWQAICDEASKQSLRAWFPQVEPLLSSKQVAESIAQSSLGLVLVLDPTATKGLTAVLDSIELTRKSITLLVGAEGGITSAELEAFEAAGATRVHLGTGILRTSTAGMAAIAAINSAAGYYQ